MHVVILILIGLKIDLCIPLTRTNLSLDITTKIVITELESLEVHTKNQNNKLLVRQKSRFISNRLFHFLLRATPQFGK